MTTCPFTFYISSRCEPRWRGLFFADAEDLRGAQTQFWGFSLLGHIWRFGAASRIYDFISIGIKWATGYAIKLGFAPSGRTDAKSTSVLNFEKILM